MRGILLRTGLKRNILYIIILFRQCSPKLDYFPFTCLCCFSFSSSGVLVSNGCCMFGGSVNDDDEVVLMVEVMEVNIMFFGLKYLNTYCW